MLNEVIRLKVHRCLVSLFTFSSLCKGGVIPAANKEVHAEERSSTYRSELKHCDIATSSRISAFTVTSTQ